MATKRHFLGWDSPIIDKVSEYILQTTQATEGRPLDLEDLLVVVPTRQAGRRLRETLARWCDLHDSALLSARVVTPHYFFIDDTPSQPIADPIVSTITWIKVLMTADLSTLSSLFPSVQDERTFHWALTTSRMLEDLRRDLADGAYTISGVLEQYGDQLEERERWQDLAEAEELYLSELSRTGKKDACTQKIQNTHAPQMDPTAQRIVVAALPDPSLLAIEALQHLTETYPIDILIHAPESKADDFDTWGRPIPEKWRLAEIDIPDGDNNVYLEGSPANQAERVLKTICREADQYESGEIAIGVPDTTVIPFLEKELSSQGLSSFDPSDHILADHAIGRLAARIQAVLQNPTYEHLADLLRHPDILNYLSTEQDVSSLELLQQLDIFQNNYLPMHWQNMLDRFQENPKGTSSRHQDFTELGKALSKMQALLAGFDTQTFEDAWRSFYSKVYQAKQLNPTHIGDMEFERAAAVFDRVLQEFRDLPKTCNHFNIAQLSSIFVNRLEQHSFHKDRREELLDMEGWLELPWNDKPFLLITGMNEAFVPGPGISSTFLPDSLRNLMDLRDDAARFARDIFLLTGMVEARRDKGRACLIAGKTATSGDPLKPSRLLFRCPDAMLPARVGKLLAEVENTHARPYADVVFQLEPGQAERKNDIPSTRRISVTALQSYLNCPFRFYLQHIVGMEERDDRKTGMDNMDFGTMVHHVLESMGKHRELWACPDADKLGRQLADLAEKYLTDLFGRSPSLSIQIAFQAAVERLQAAAREQVRLTEDGWEIEQVETDETKRTKAHLRRYGFTIHGRIDRIDRNTRDGRIRIIDYKTSNTPTMPDIAHLATRRDDTPSYNRLTPLGSPSKEKQWINLQLPVYAMMHTAGTRDLDNLELAYFNLPKATTETRVAVWHDLSPDVMQSAATCLDGILKAIDAGVFWPLAKRTPYEDPFERLFFYDAERAFRVPEHMKGKPLS